MAKEEITIAGGTFSVPNPYEVGQVITAGEADALNQVLHENIRNNLAKQAKAGTLSQAEVDAYADKYEFGVRTGGGGGGPRDPIKARAMDIARDKVKAALGKTGKKISDYSGKQISAAASTALEKHPEWLDLAKRQVEDERALAGEVLDDVVAGMGAPNEAAAAPEVAQPQTGPV